MHQIKKTVLFKKRLYLILYVIKSKIPIKNGDFRRCLHLQWFNSHSQVINYPRKYGIVPKNWFCEGLYFALSDGDLRWIR